MRRKIANKLRKEAIRKGVVIVEEYWKKDKLGYVVTVDLDAVVFYDTGVYFHYVGRDELYAYRALINDIKAGKNIMNLRGW